MPFAEVGKSRGTPFNLYYDLHGNAESPVKLLFIMGFATASSAWKMQVDHFSKDGKYQLCVFDNRGVGKSTDISPGRFKTTDMAQDAAELIDHLGWTEYHLIGVSMGGMIAQELTFLHQDRVLSLTLSCTHAGGKHSGAPFAGVKKLLSLMREQDLLKKCDLALEVLYSDAYLANETTKSELVEWWLHRARTEPALQLRFYFSQLLAPITHHVSQDRLLKLKESQLPILVMTGTNDLLVKHENSFDLKEILDPKIFLVFDGAGHGINVECREQWNKAVEDIIQLGLEWKGSRNNTPLSEPQHTV